MKTSMPYLQKPCSKPASTLFALALLMQPAVAATKVWDGGGNDGFWQNGVNWDANTAPAPGDVLVFTNTTRLNNTNNFPAGTGFGGISFSSPAGAFTLYGNAINLNGNLSDNQPVTTESINLPLVLTADRNVNVSDTAALNLNGAISGGFGLSKSGGGLLTLGGANTYTGPSTIAAGTLSISSDGNLGTAPAATTAGSIVISNGILRGTASLTIDPNRGIALGPNSGAAQGRVDVSSGSTIIYRGIMANNGGTGGLTKGLFGGLTLSGANTYTGPTIIKNGTLSLDFTQAGSPLTDVISSSSALTLGGENAGLGAANRADLTVNGGTGDNVQNFNGTTIELGPAVVRTLGGAGTATIRFGSLTHVPGGQLVLHTNATGRLNTTTPNTHGILGGWVVTGNGGVFNNISMGTEFATVDGSGNILPYSGYTVHQNALGNLDTYVGSPGTELEFAL